MNRLSRISSSMMFWQVMVFVTLAVAYAAIAGWYLNPRVVIKKENIYLIYDASDLDKEPVETRVI